MKLSGRLRSVLRVLRSAARRTDRRRWRNLASNPVYTTDERNRLIAGLIPPGSSVLDIGCGLQTLRRYLPAGCEYQPCDLDASAAGVLQCDLNAGVWPAVSKRYEYVVCSGMLEFLRDPRAFLEGVGAVGDHLLLTYYTVRPGGRSRLRRLSCGYLNHLTQAELEQLFSEAGLRYEQKAESDGPIYAIDLRPGAARAGRA